MNLIDKLKLKFNKLKQKNKTKKQSKIKLNIEKKFKDKLFLAELIMGIAFIIFTVTNFLLNLFLGLYILSFSLMALGWFIFKYF